MRMLAAYIIATVMALTLSLNVAPAISQALGNTTADIVGLSHGR